MMEVFVRIAIHKYFKTRIVDDVYAAIEKFFIENLSKFLGNYDP